MKIVFCDAENACEMRTHTPVKPVFVFQCMLAKGQFRAEILSAPPAIPFWLRYTHGGARCCHHHPAFSGVWTIPARATPPLRLPCSAKDDGLAVPREVLIGSLTTPEGVCTVEWSQGHAPGLQPWPFFRVDEPYFGHVCNSVRLSVR